MVFFRLEKLFVLGVIIGASLFAHECPQEKLCHSESEIESICPSDVKPHKFNFRHIEGDGIGYKKGYSTTELFFSRMVDRHLVYLDGRGHLTNDAKWASNAGLGYRFRHDDIKRVHGVNLFFDYRRAKNASFQQVGVGLESLGERLNYRANGYFPVGKTTKTTSTTFDRFIGNHLQLTSTIKQAMWGVEGELGSSYLHYKDMKFDLALGAYYFKGAKSKTAVGGKARAGVYFYDTFYVKGMTSYDRLFDFNLQGEVGISLSFFKPLRSKFDRSKKGCEPKICCHDDIGQMRRMTQLPIRQDLVVVSRAHKTELAKDVQGFPYFFYHVENTSTNSLGTFENPFATLAEAETASVNGETVYVLGGNGTSFGMSDGFTLKNDQKLWSAFVTHPLSTQYGSIGITPQSSIRPVITNTNNLQPGVTLADGSEVTGFNISASSGSGVLGTNLTRGAKVSQNILNNNGTGAGTQAGIELQLADGVVLSDTMEFTNNTITSENGATDGILIIPFSAPLNGPVGLDVKINNNTIGSNASQGVRIIRTGLPTGEFALSGEINNNFFNGNDSEGIYFDHDDENGTVNLNLTIRGNSFIGNTDGILFTRAAGTMKIEDNYFSNNSDNAVLVDVGDSLPLFEDLTIDIINNQFFDNAGTGMEVDLNRGTVNCRLIGNTYRVGGTANSLFLDNDSGTTSNFKATIRNNAGPLTLNNVEVLP